MREITEYKWEELRTRLRRRIVRVGETQQGILEAINQEPDMWQKVQKLIKKDQCDREIEAYHRILKTMDNLEQDES